MHTHVAILTSPTTAEATALYATALGEALGKAGAIVVATTQSVAEKNVLAAARKNAWPIDRASHEAACALASVVVVLQSSSHRCSSFRAATRAFVGSKRVWVIVPPPWMPDADGSIILARRPGIRPLWRTHHLVVSLGLANATSNVYREDPFEQRVVDALKAPLYKDRLLEATNLSFAELSTALFNLLVDGVILEGLDGRFELVQR